MAQSGNQVAIERQAWEASKKRDRKALSGLQVQESGDDLLARLRHFPIAKTRVTSAPTLVLLEAPRDKPAAAPSPHEPRVGKLGNSNRGKAQNFVSSVTMLRTRSSARRGRQSERRRHSFWAPPRSVPGSTRRPYPFGLSGRGYALGWPSSRPGMRAKRVGKGYMRPFKIQADRDAFAKLQTSKTRKRKPRAR